MDKNGDGRERPDPMGRRIDMSLASIVWFWLPVALLLCSGAGYGLYRLACWIF